MSARARYNLFAVCPPGFEQVTANELLALGIANPRPLPGGVSFRGFLSHLYKVNLWSRTSERVLLRLGEFRALTFKELHDKARRLDWHEFLSPGSPVSIRVTCRKSRLIHSEAVAERIIAALSEQLGQPANVVPLDERNASIEQPLIIVRIFHDLCTLSLDTSGALLHFRGYRQATAKAPLRETLAASMLLASGWPIDRPLLDPFCGSGTLPIEAALIARKIAPGRQRRFAFMNWSNFDQPSWDELLAEADRSVRPTAPAIIQGSDRDAGAIEASRSNAARAGVLNDIEFRQQAVSAIEPIGPGWIVSNLPYGKRIDDDRDLRNLYARFGQVLRARCAGWQVALLTGSAQLERQIDLNFQAAIRVSNGGLAVRFVRAEVPA
jgi:putative N6-adenine-specific DNA methylase